MHGLSPSLNGSEHDDLAGCKFGNWLIVEIEAYGSNALGSRLYDFHGAKQATMQRSELRTAGPALKGEDAPTGET